MKLIFLIMGLLTSQHSFALNVSDLIRQNVEQAQKSLEKEKEEPAQLWIQVRSEEQKQLLQNIANWLKPVDFIEIKPLELVTKGPKKTQLRFFSSQDKDKANVLLKSLEKIFPQMELKDLSVEYGKTRWLEKGHFELWLAPDLKSITQPEPPPPPPPASSEPPANTQ